MGGKWHKVLVINFASESENVRARKAARAQERERLSRAVLCCEYGALSLIAE